MIRTLVVLAAFVASGCANNTESVQENVKVKKSFYEDGTVRSELSFKDGKKNGVGITYYQNGEVRSEFNYVDGKKEGKNKNYYQEGGLSSDVNYSNDKKHGSYIKYYKTGVTYVDCYYENGKLHGERTVYSREGKVKSVMKYADGLPLPGTKRLKPNGEIKAPIRIKFILDDKTELTGKAKLYLELDQKMKDVVYYQGSIGTDGNYKDGFRYPIDIDSKDRGYIEYYKSPYGMVMKKVEVVAIAKDRDQQVHIITGVFNLVLD